MSRHHSTTTLVLPSPAKLNLFLHVCGRRTDGYHNLQTVFQLLDYGDELILSVAGEGINISPAMPNLPVKDNLIFKAASLLQKATGCRLGANIQLQKRLPMGGGIGGGSSNAATTLLGLNQLWQTGLTLDELAELGRQLGADVPVFVRGKSAWAEGVGERLTALDLPGLWYLVLTPGCHVSTAAVFAHKDLTRDTPAITVAAFLGGGGKNDCQPLVEALFPQVRSAVDWLNNFCDENSGAARLGPARLTGTGACVFAAFPTKAAAQAVLARRPGQLKGFVAQGVNRSPLHQCLFQ